MRYIIALVTIFSVPWVQASEYSDWLRPYNRADSNTVALFHFNEASGIIVYGEDNNSTTAYSGSFRNNNSASAAWMYGKDCVWNGALLFDGSNGQGIEINQLNGELNAARGDSTIEMWFVIDEPNGTFVLAQCGLNYQIKVLNGILSTSFKAQAGPLFPWRSTIGTAKVSENEWHHVAVTRQITGISTGDVSVDLYLDGELYASSSWEDINLPPDTNDDLHIGFDAWGSSELKGTIDEFRISNGLRNFLEESADEYWNRPFNYQEDYTKSVFHFDENQGITIYGGDPNSTTAFAGTFVDNDSNSAGWVSSFDTEFGYALEFDGSDGQGVCFPQSGELDIVEGPGSIETWFKINNGGQIQVIAQIGWPWQIKLTSDGRVSFSYKTGGSWYATTGTQVLNTGQWYHLIITRDITNISGNSCDIFTRVYIDGELYASKDETNIDKPASSSSPLYVGCDAWEAEEFDGVVDELRVSNCLRVVQELPDYHRNVLHNPLMGWTYNTEPARYIYEEIGPDLPGEEHDVVALFIGWDEIEPNEGEYDWSDLDSAIDELKKRDKTVYLRLQLVPAQTECWDINGTPDWLFDDYDVNYIVVDDDPNTVPLAFKHPYYWDPNFQQKSKTFLQAFASRYDGSQVDNIDVLIYANTGEWECGHNLFPWEDFPDVNKTDVLNDLVDIYYDVFKDSDVSVAINFAAWFDVNGPDFMHDIALDTAMDYGFGIRYAAFTHGAIAPYVADAINEHVDDTYITGETGGGWQPDVYDVNITLDHMLLNHLTQASYGMVRCALDEFVNDYDDLAERGLLNMGYRFVVEEAVYPSVLPAGSRFTLDTVWLNHSVGRLFKPYYLRAYLVSSDGEVVWSQLDNDFDPTEFVNGNEYDVNEPNNWFSNCNEYSVESSFVLSDTIPEGTYDLKIAVENSKKNWWEYPNNWIFPYDVNEPNTVFLFHMDEGSGLTTAGYSSFGDVDNIELSFDANGEGWTSGPNGFGNAIYFDGIETVTGANSGYHEGLELTDEGWSTAEMWIDVNSYSWSGYAVLAKNQIRSWVIQLTDGGKVRYSWYTDANGWSTPLIGNKSIPAGEWHHIAIVRNIEFDAADPNYGDIYTAIYIDGKFDNSVIYNNERLPKPNPNGLTIISVGHWGQFEGTFNGAIDELRLSNCNRFLYNHQAIDLAIEGGDELRRFKIGTIEIKEATY